MSPPEAPAEVLKIAVVGTGIRAQDHLASILKLHDLYRLVAVCDAVSERAHEVANRLQVKPYLGVDEMLERERPDVVMVTVPPEAHHTVACAVARHKAHVLCETPISVTLPYADQMVRAARDHGVKLEVAENVWRFPQERFKRVLLDSGLLGEVTSIRLWYASGSYHGMNAVRTLAGGNPVRAMGMARVLPSSGGRGGDPYHFRVFGPPGESPPVPRQESKWATWEAGLFEFDNGVTLVYELPASRIRGNWWEVEATNGHMAGNDVFIQKPERRCRIVAETEPVEGTPVVTRVRLYENDRPVSGLVWVNPFVRYRPANTDEVARMDQLVSIYRAATEGIEPEYGAANGRKDAEMLVALRESALLGGAPVSLPLAGVTRYEKRLLDVFGPVEAL